MKLNEALHYLNYSVKEGYISEEYAQELMELPWKKMIEEVEKMMDRADSYYESLKEKYDTKRDNS